MNQVQKSGMKIYVCAFHHIAFAEDSIILELL